MVSKKDIKDYEFETIEDYFQYIIDSKSNGATKQVRELIKKLSKDQIIEFNKWLTINFNAVISVVYKDLLIEILCK